MKPIPKSLHTVTVLVTVAKLIQASTPYSNAGAVNAALVLLGYDPATDTYELATKATKQLNKGK